MNNLAPDIALHARATDQADAPGRPPHPVQLALKVAAAMCESFGDETLGHHRLTMPTVTVFMVLILIVLFHRGGKLSMNRDRSGVGSSSSRAYLRRSSPWPRANVLPALSYSGRNVPAAVVPAPTGAERRVLSRPQSRAQQRLPPPIYPDIGPPPPVYFPPLSRCPSYAPASPSLPSEFWRYSTPESPPSLSPTATERRRSRC